MEYKRINDVIIARIDPEEEVMEKMKEIAVKEKIRLANVNALGAVNDFTVGVYDLEQQQFHANTFRGAYEVVSFTGSINTMNGEYYGHIHMSAADKSGHTWGGHLNRAVVSATFEMFIWIIDGTVDRRKDPENGLNIFSF